MKDKKKHREKPGAKKKPLTTAELIQVIAILVQVVMWLLDKLLSSKE